MKGFGVACGLAIQLFRRPPWLGKQQKWQLAMAASNNSFKADGFAAA
jgi:hypothetical protein